MTVSHLTSSIASLQAGALSDLSGDGYPFNRLTTNLDQFIAATLSDLTGTSYSHLTTPRAELLARLRNELDGGSSSALIMSVAEIMAGIVNAPPVEQAAAPVITSNGAGPTASISVAENQTAVTTVTATDANEGATLTYSITGGADAAKFEIDDETGVLTFADAPDFETPTDANADNIYVVIVQVSDGSLTDTQTISVTVTDVEEGGGGFQSSTFGGVATYLTQSFGGADSSLFSFAFVANLDLAQPNTPFFIEDVPGEILNCIGVSVQEGVIQISAEDDVVIADGSTWNFGGPKIGSGWHVYIGTVSTNHAAGAKKCVLYVDRVKVLPVSVSDNSDPFTMPLNGIPLGIGALPPGGSVSDGDMAYIWLKRGTSLLDGSDNIPDATLNKFVLSDGTLVDLGANGSEPTGSQPDVYLKGAAATFVTNLGTSGAFVLGDSEFPLTDGDAVSAVTPWVAPLITSNGGGATASISVAENQTAVTTVALTVNMPGQTAVYSIVSGLGDDGDEGAFTIDSETGVLVFAVAPDFEEPTDLNTDNIYEVTVRGSDGLVYDTQALSVTVTNVGE